MNGPGDIPISNCTATERPCGFSILPSLGMSCRGRAEAFARHLSSKLRTLGNSQNGDSPIHDDDPILNGSGPNTWITHVDQSNQVVTALQPLRHTTSQEAADSFFDFDCDVESPGSPVDECEYSRLIETSTNTPHECVTESGYICSSPLTSNSRASSQSSDGPYFDPISSDGEQLTDAANKQQQQQQQQQQLQQLNGQIKYNIKHTTTPVDINEKSILSPAMNNNNNNIEVENKMLLLNGHCTYEITDTDEVDFQHVNEKEIDKNIITDTTAILCQNHQDDIIMSKSAILCQNHQDDIIINDLKLINKLNISNIEENEEQNKEKIDSIEILQSNNSNHSSILSRNSDNDILDQEIVLNELQKLSANDTDLQNNDHCLNEIDNTETVTDDNVKINDKNILNLEVSVQSATPKTTNDESQKLLEQTLNGTNEENLTNNKIITPTTTDNHLPLKEDTDDDDDCRPQRVRRCSSLKTGKTPPGTPGRKKIVRFADVLGLDLADVKTFMDEIPNIPVSAYQDLEIIESEPPIQLGPKADKILMPLFQPPGSVPSFLDTIRDKQVNLENALISDPINLTISGSVRVRNLDFHKSVYMRYTFDNWRTFSDIPAKYVQNSCDGFSDKFTFTIYANTLSVGQRLEFAVCFQCKGQQYWDNNYGANYCFQCLPATNTQQSRHILPSHHISSSLLSPTSDAWCVSFY